MPPGSALVFDLVRAPDGEYGVRLRFASMTLNQFRTEKPIEGGIKVSPVAYTGCSGDGCVMPLAQFESLGLTLEAQGFVHDQWDAFPSKLEKDPGSSTALKDPSWTEPLCGTPSRGAGTCICRRRFRPSRPEDKPWGMYEFAIPDPDETLVRIGWPSRFRQKREGDR
jgi:hypothetical protein